MKIAVASDHGGFDIKEVVKARLQARGLDVEDLGCHGLESVDYPDYASQVAGRVSHGAVDQGVLVCTTGIGMSIAANKFPRVRAALCMSPDMAKMARTHNDANILVLSGACVGKDDVDAILEAWFAHPFEGGRHERRVRKLGRYAAKATDADDVFLEDPETYRAIQDETNRQQNTLNLIASENHVSRAVRAAQGSVLTNKYAEGYPGKRWYNGCGHVDTAEAIAIDRAENLFKAEHANVQLHCGSSANMAVYFAVLQPGDTILAMNLSHGGHLTHGNKMNFSGRLFNIVSYGVEEATGRINYDEVARLAEQHKPKLIVAGASSYPRLLDFDRFGEIAERVGAYFMVDMAHIAGLIAGGAHPSPVQAAHFVTGTTHKTLRGPRGGMVLCRQSFAEAIDREVFPGIQGGPLMHTIAAKAICFHEAMQPAFADYAQQIVRNARAMADVLLQDGLRLVSGGTDNHIVLVDLSPMKMTGKDAATALEKAGLVLNKNVIPFDRQNPFLTSGIRIGTPAVTTRGMGESEAQTIAKMIATVVHHPEDQAVLARTREQVAELAAAFPVD